MKIYDLGEKEVRNPLDHSLIKGVKEGILQFTASRHAYYVAQLGLLSEFEETLRVRTHPVIGECTLENVVCCFNTMGLNSSGKAVDLPLILKERELTPVFVGFDFRGAETGNYVTALEFGARKIPVYIRLTDDLVFDGGCEDGNTLARLQWLNSDLMRNEAIVSPYDPIKVEEDRIAFTAKTAAIGLNGWLENVVSYIDMSGDRSDAPQNVLFSCPMEISVDGQKFEYTKMKVSGGGRRAKIIAEGKSDAMRIETRAKISYEGYFKYETVLTAEKDLIIPNIALSLSFADAKYAVGLGRKGGRLEEADFRWDANKNQDSVYVGNVNCGLRLRLYEKGATLSPPSAKYGQTPLHMPRDSWENRGKGGILLRKDGEEGALLQAYTGMVVLPAGKSLNFCYDIHLTPFHPVDRKMQYGTRLLQNKKFTTGELDLDSAELDGLNYIAIHRANSINPLLNYPFGNEKELKKFVSEAHKRNIGVLIYDTYKEISTFAPEYKAFRAMADELLADELNGTDTVVGVQKITAGKRKGDWDRSVALRRGSRMENFYVEGLHYLIEHVGLDGIFSDETFATRETMERVKKLLMAKRGVPGYVDLGVKCAHDDRAGYISGLHLNTEVLPFVDKVWVKKNASAKTDPDYFLTEASGLLYGLTADVPYCKKSPLISMLFGMNARYGWYGNRADKAIASIHRYYRRFGMADAKFYGYWDPRNPVAVGNEDILVSAFVRGDRVSAVFFNASDRKKSFEFGLNADGELKDADYLRRYPSLKGVQKRKLFGFKKSLTLRPGKGCLVEFRLGLTALLNNK